MWEGLGIIGAGAVQFKDTRKTDGNTFFFFFFFLTGILLSAGIADTFQEEIVVTNHQIAIMRKENYSPSKEIISLRVHLLLIRRNTTNDIFVGLTFCLL